jgi:hypothetical protein
MLPDPLHPAVVHFPIVLMAFLPFAALGALWALHRGASPIRAWIAPVALAGALTLSAWAALQTGQAQEDRAEDVVGERVLETHEEAAERFLLFSGIVFVIAAAGLVPGAAGRGARFVATAATLGLLVAGYQVGHSGGAIVYGAAGAPGISQLSGATVTEGGASGARRGGEKDDD